MATRVSVGTAKQLIGCSDDHVRNLIESGELEAIDVRKPGASRPRWSVSRCSLERFLARRKSAEQETADRADGVESQSR